MICLIKCALAISVGFEFVGEETERLGALSKGFDLDDLPLPNWDISQHFRRYNRVVECKAHSHINTKIMTVTLTLDSSFNGLFSLLFMQLRSSLLVHQYTN